jgi:hypothetical protein
MTWELLREAVAGDLCAARLSRDWEQASWYPSVDNLQEGQNSVRDWDARLAAADAERVKLTDAGDRLPETAARLPPRRYRLRAQPQR